MLCPGLTRLQLVSSELYKDTAAQIRGSAVYFVLQLIITLLSMQSTPPQNIKTELQSCDEKKAKDEQSILILPKAVDVPGVGVSKILRYSNCAKYQILRPQR